MSKLDIDFNLIPKSSTPLIPSHTWEEMRVERNYIKGRRVTPLDLTKVSLHNDLNDYLESLKYNTSKGTPATPESIIKVRSCYQQFYSFITKPPSKLTRTDINQYIKKARKYRYASSTINGTCRLFNAFFNYRFNEGDHYPCPYCGSTKIRPIIINSNRTVYYCGECDKPLNPFHGVKFPKAERRNDETLTLEDVNKVLAWSAVLSQSRTLWQYQGIIRIGLETASRKGEILSLGLSAEVENYVDLKASEIVLRKTKGKKRIRERRPISTTTRDIILEGAYHLKENHGVLDVSERIFRIDPTTLWYHFKFIQLNSKMEKNLYPHLTRATFATEFWRKYHSEEALKRAGGWSSDAYKAYLRITEEDVLKRSREFVRDTWDLKEVVETLGASS